MMEADLHMVGWKKGPIDNIHTIPRLQIFIYTYFTYFLWVETCPPTQLLPPGSWGLDENCYCIPFLTHTSAL